MKRLQWVASPWLRRSNIIWEAIKICGNYKQIISATFTHDFKNYKVALCIKKYYTHSLYFYYTRIYYYISSHACMHVYCGVSTILWHNITHIIKHTQTHTHTHICIIFTSICIHIETSKRIYLTKPIPLRLFSISEILSDIWLCFLLWPYPLWKSWLQTLVYWGIWQFVNKKIFILFYT